MARGPGPAEFMIGCQKGLIFCKITEEDTFSIIEAVDEYIGLYVVNLEWAGDMRYVVVTSRPRFANKRDVPRGEENYAVISYSLFDGDEEAPSRRLTILGQYRTNFSQATFSLNKLQVIAARQSNSKNL